ncbi:hypothetical protein QUB60_03125 [Microcoleus sp. A2-C5]|uniref:hypothetical protein n=1 Tax=unclassified Microcoleus TaxID=2642155 RepID=UPI002FD3F061
MGIAHLNATGRSYKSAIAKLNQDEPLIKFIGQVELRNSRRVYYLEDFYRVEQINPNREQVTYGNDIIDYRFPIPDSQLLLGDKMHPKIPISHTNAAD